MFFCHKNIFIVKIRYFVWLYILMMSLRYNVESDKRFDLNFEIKQFY